jgi:hypothetical protein
LRYCRSRVFTFVFFIQKLTGISSVQNNKSCRIIHHESNKIGPAFFWFFCDFLRILQESGKLHHYWRYPFAETPSERYSSLQCHPWGGRAAAVRPNSGQPPTGAGRARAGEGPWVARARFAGLVGVVSDRWGGTPAARRGGRRGLLSCGVTRCRWGTWGVGELQ